jgi:hypothetical protein
MLVSEQITLADVPMKQMSWNTSQLPVKKNTYLIPGITIKQSIFQLHGVIRMDFTKQPGSFPSVTDRCQLKTSNIQ